MYFIYSSGQTAAALGPRLLPHAFTPLTHWSDEPYVFLPPHAHTSSMAQSYTDPPIMHWHWFR